MIRPSLIRRLRSLPYFKGRDRLAAYLSARLPGGPVRTSCGLLMDLDPREWVQQEIYLSGGAEPRTVGLIRKVLSTGASFVDVGAHVGEHALVAASVVGPTGLVLAIDPQPYNVEKIGRNAALNGFTWLTAICAAVSDCDGLVDLPFQRATDKARLSLATPSPNDLDQRFRVASVRLDTITAGLPARPIVLKVDVEGHEPTVLASGSDSLRKADHVIMEHLPGCSDAPITMLETAGFSLFDVDGRKWRRGEGLPESNVWARRAA